MSKEEAIKDMKKYIDDKLQEKTHEIEVALKGMRKELATEIKEYLKQNDNKINGRVISVSEEERLLEDLIQESTQVSNEWLRKVCDEIGRKIEVDFEGKDDKEIEKISTDYKSKLDKVFKDTEYEIKLNADGEDARIDIEIFIPALN